MDKYKNNIKISLTILIIMFFLLAGYMGYALFFYGDRWFSSPYNTRVRMSGAQPQIIAGDILDRKNTVLATTKNGNYTDPKTGEAKQGYYREYNSKCRYASHVVGFHNEYGRAGAEAFHIKYLMGYNNNIFERIYQKAFLSQERGNDIMLTIDIQLQQYISELLGNRKGSVVLLNPKTGEILAMVSKPSFDPNNVSNVDGDTLIDRSIQGLYPPGSILKVVTAASALEHIEDIDSWTYNCTGSLDIDGKKISCYDGKAHEEVDLASAMIYSCNGAFAQLGNQIGWKELLETGKKFGFNKNFLFSDIMVYDSSLNIDKTTSKEELGWTAIGQAETLVAPFHMAMVAAAVANDGVIMEPKLLYSVVGRNGRAQKGVEPKVFSEAMTKESARVIKEMMVRVVSEGTGRSANVGGVSIGGKTGTAEVKSTKESQTLPHAWFIGFAPTEDPTLAIAVVVENSGTGGRVAAPIAGKVLRRAHELGY